MRSENASPPLHIYSCGIFSLELHEVFRNTKFDHTELYQRSIPAAVFLLSSLHFSLPFFNFSVFFLPFLYSENMSFSCTPCLGSEMTLLLYFLNQCSEIGLEVNSDKTEYMFKSRDQNAGRS
jgi:hypothetical protein